MVAGEELWILGTDQLDAMISKLEAMKREHDKDPEQNYLFIQERFKIVAQLKSEINGEFVNKPHLFVRKILNDLIHHLNNRPRMAKYILVIIGPEILDDENFMRIGFKTVFTWLLDEIQFTIIDRCGSVPIKVGNVSVPEVIFAKMVPKPEHAATPKFKSGRRKFNKLLETQLKQFQKVKFSFLNVGEITSEALDYFHKNGTLNDSGTLAYWVAINNVVRTMIERDKDTKKPFDNSTQTDDALLDDHIKIQAERLLNQRTQQRPRQQTDRYFGNNAEQPRTQYYNRDRMSHSRSHSYDPNDRYHYYRNGGSRSYKN